MSETNTGNKKSATERLEDLENLTQRVIQAIQPLESSLRDIAGLREALKLLNNKLDAVVKSVNAGGPITDDGISKYMVENNVKELTSRVEGMVSQGMLVATDTVSKESFVVVNEADASGTIVNPRMQFLLSALDNEEVRTKLEGAKTGDNIFIGDKGASINILEAYTLATPQAPAAEPSAPEASTDASAPASTDASTAGSTEATA